jgi:stage III sporulation protein AE
MKKVIFIAVYFFVSSFITSTYTMANYINEIELLDSHLEMFGIDEIDNMLKNSDTIYRGYTFTDIVSEAMTGQLNFSFSNIINTFMRILFKEMFANTQIIKQIIILILLSALLKNLTESFKNKGVGELGFYVTYIILVMYLLASFYIAVGIVNQVISNISEIMRVTMPLMIGLMVMSGNIASSYIFSPLVLFAANGVNFFIGNFLAPAIILSASLTVVNYLTEKEMLSSFSSLLKDMCGYTLKMSGILFLSILSIQRVSVPIMNNLAMRTTKSVVGAIPVVGDVLNGAVSSVLYFTSAVKSASLVAIVLMIISVSIVPIINMLAIALSYKFLAAVTQPIADPRVTKCINCMAEYTYMLLGCIVTVMVMFIFSVMIMLSL